MILYVVYNFHHKTVAAAAEIVGTIGHSSFADVSPNDIMRRVNQYEVRTLAEYLPEIEPFSLVNGTAPAKIQSIWDNCTTAKHYSSKQWIY